VTDMAFSLNLTIKVEGISSIDEVSNLQHAIMLAVETCGYQVERDGWGFVGSKKKQGTDQ
jgi:hypothetical protein